MIFAPFGARIMDQVLASIIPLIPPRNGRSGLTQSTHAIIPPKVDTQTNNRDASRVATRYETIDNSVVAASVLLSSETSALADEITEWPLRSMSMIPNRGFVGAEVLGNVLLFLL